jgi:GAF domain-containing protein
MTARFVSVTAIGLIPSIGIPIWWLLVPIAAYLALDVYEYGDSITEKQRLVKAQLVVLSRSLNVSHEHHLRCTYHVPARRHQLRQAFDYVPFGGGGGRVFPRTKGIIATVFEAKDTRVENFATDAEFRQRMLDTYNYSVEELRRITTDRRSYLCVPITDENHRVLGLIYFDSAINNTFQLDPPNMVTESVISTSGVIRDSLL